MFSRRNESLKVSLIIGLFLLFTICLSALCELNNLEYLGLIFSISICCWVTYNIVWTFWDSYLGVICKKNVDFRKLGQWAVITGATDGIGLAYAKQLAERKINVVLISRNEEKLKTLAKEIEATYGVRTRIVQVDFSQRLQEYESKVESALSDLEIGTLINNVGMTYKRPAYFDEVCQDSEWISNMININVVATSVMTKIVLPEMVERNKGAIINIGSMASLNGMPFLALYAATKSFMQSLTLDLEYEYQDTGITFQYQAAGYVHTKIAKVKHASIFIPTPEQYASAGLRSVGLQQNSMIWLPLRFLHFFIRVMESVHPKCLRKIMGSAGYTFWLYVKKREMSRSRNIGAIV